VLRAFAAAPPPSSLPTTSTCPLFASSVSSVQPSCGRHRRMGGCKLLQVLLQSVARVAVSVSVGVSVSVKSQSQRHRQRQRDEPHGRCRCCCKLLRLQSGVQQSSR
jgi:hypothetical protein